MTRVLASVLAAAFISIPSITLAWDETDARGVEFFENRIRPVLVDRCYKCHSADAEKVGGGLLLDSREGSRRGGESGHAIVPNDAKNSLLLDAIQYKTFEMPPDERLSPEIVGDFQRWIEMGAPDPRDGAKPSKENESPLAEQLWSLRPLSMHEAPSVRQKDWARCDIDRFVLARLEASELKPVEDAKPRELLRRVHFDLVGLPPSLETVDLFAADHSAAAFEAVVDQLLESPQFGERWGRHWLDVVRYAESNGKDRDVLLPHAWRYRDYVIDAVNTDLPYDRFITEQIAGDLLPAESPVERDRLRIATGMLAIGAKSLTANLQMDLVDDQIDVVCRAVLGLTASCARCHDHKFDPIPTRDYYALAGIFRSTETLFGGGLKKPKNLAARKDVLWVLERDTRSREDAAFAIGVRESSKVEDCRIHIRGERNRQGESVPRGFLSCIKLADAPVVETKQSGRLQLAAWLVHRDNPLTARVAVNRIWLHLFGRGLVESVDNFGSSSQPPSHPRLLDYLARRFMEQGWSTKKLIREIVLSRSYQLSTALDPRNNDLDPENKLQWRMSRRRLESEAIRDALLAAGGNLQLDRPYASAVARIGDGEWGRGIDTTPLDKPAAYRSVYLPIIRGHVPEAMKIFDFPEPSNIQGQRDTTNVPAQSLYLMNSPFVIEQAQGLAARAIEASEDMPSRLELIYKACLARTPLEHELDLAASFVRSQEARLADESAAWTSLCHALFASSEFRYLD